MKRVHCFLTLAYILAFSPVFADKYNPYQVEVTGSRVLKAGDNLQMEFIIDYSHLIVPPNDELLIRPVILGERDTLRLPYLLFPGKTRDKVNQRKARLYGDEADIPEPYATLYPGSETPFVYRQVIPFTPWMYGARLELQQDIYGCAGCHRILSDIALNYIANPPKVAFIVPVQDTIGQEQVYLYINFPWDQAVILPGFRNNADELAKIDQVMDRITRERPNKLRHIHLTGYASPEGSYPYNTRLAGRRVQALKNHIARKYPDTENLYRIDTVPEDWQGVRNWTSSSALDNRQQVLDIIERTPDPDARDSKIRRLDGNSTYRRLLREAYPPLRRTEFIVNYDIQPLSPEQIQSLYRTNPERLTPYELYSLASTYPQESPGFYDVIVVASRLYPEDPAAANNLAAAALQREDTATARQYLLKCGNSPQAINNQGVLMMLEGRYPEACQCFRDAQAGGCREAILNLHNLERAQLIP